MVSKNTSKNPSQKSFGKDATTEYNNEKRQGTQPSNKNEQHTEYSVNQERLGYQDQSTAAANDQRPSNNKTSKQKQSS